MNPKHLEVALEKQRLQFAIQLQREELVRDLTGITAALDTIDRVRDGVGWARRHAPVLSSIALAILVAKPHLAARLARRAWLTWLLYRRAAPGIASILAMLQQVRQARSRG